MKTFNYPNDIIQLSIGKNRSWKNPNLKKLPYKTTSRSLALSKARREGTTTVTESGLNT